MELLALVYKTYGQADTYGFVSSSDLPGGLSLPSWTVRVPTREGLIHTSHTRGQDVYKRLTL
jgi:hypothetical protein